MEDTATTQVSVDTSGRARAIGKPAIRTRQSELDKAAHDMEGYFVGMLLKQMHTAAAKGGLFDSDSESSTYREMFDDAVSSEIGKRGTFGIADMLTKELIVRTQGPEVPAKENGSGQ